MWIFLLSILATGCSRTGLEKAAALTNDQSHVQMVRTLEMIDDQLRDSNVYLGDAPNRQLQQELASGAAATDPATRWRTMYQLAIFELNQERFESGMRYFSEAEALLPDVAEQIPEGLRKQFLMDVGVAYLRMGETANCCRRNTPESCLLPIRGTGVHVDQQWSRTAISYFARLLQETDSSEPIYSACQWLLNVAYMTLGEHPDQVPAEYLIAEERFASDTSFPRFPNRAQAMGLDTFSLAGGVVADDFDNDGQLDLMVSTYDFSGQLRYWRNDGEGRFIDATSSAGLDGILGGLNLVQADFNNDGWTDVLVLRGGWLAAAGQLPNSLLRNNGDGTFSDVPFRAGLAEPPRPCQTAAWADFDLDGDLDLYVGNESGPQLAAPCQLFENLGDETFRDIAPAAGLDQTAVTKAVVWADYDDDGWPDLFVSNFGDPNRLYHNQRDGTFRDMAVEAGVDQPLLSFPAWFWDYDQDGHLDLFVGAYAGGIAEVGAFYAGREFDGRQTIPYLYRGLGSGKFENVAQATGLDAPHHPMGCNFGDLDNDGWLDFYLGTGWPDIREILPNAMYRNDSGKKFQDITTAGGFGHLQKGHAVVFADLDGDGDQDVFEQMGGFVPCDRYYDACFENPGNGNHWIGLKLVGRKANRSAIGARIQVGFDTPEGPRNLIRYVSSGGSFGANPLAQQIGLGPTVENLHVDIRWPGEVGVQRLEGLNVDQWSEVIQRTDHDIPRRRESSHLPQNGST